MNTLAMVVVYRLRKSAQDEEVLGSIPAPYSFYSKEPAVQKFALCPRSLKKDG